MLQKFRTDSDAVVAHLEAQMGIAPGDLRQAEDGKFDLSAFRRVLYRIGQQIQQNLAQT